MKYVDGFVVPVPKKNVAVYRRIARQAGKLWREHGALEYCECVGDDLKVKMGLPFPRLSRINPTRRCSSHGLSTNRARIATA